MISERIRKMYKPFAFVKMDPHYLAMVMIDEDPEYLEWQKNRGSYLRNQMIDLGNKIEELQKEYDKYDSEYNEMYNATIERLEPVAEQNLIDYIRELIRKELV